MIEPLNFDDLPKYNRRTQRLINATIASVSTDAIDALQTALTHWVGQPCRLHLVSVVPGTFLSENGVSVLLNRPGISGDVTLHLDHTLCKMMLGEDRDNAFTEFEHGFITTAAADILDRTRLAGFPPCQLRTGDKKIESTDSTRVLCVTIDVGADPAIGTLQLVAHEKWWTRWVEDLGPPALNLNKFNLEIPAFVLLGTLKIRRDVLQELESGDVLFPDHGVHSGEISGGDFAQLLVAGLRANARLAVHGQNWLCEVRAMLKPGIAVANDIDLSQTEPLASATVQVDIRLGETTISLGDLSSLAPGYVIELPQPVGTAVDVLVNGQNLARGELVNIEGRLGVRLVSVNR